MGIARYKYMLLFDEYTHTLFITLISTLYTR